MSAANHLDIPPFDLVPPDEFLDYAPAGPSRRRPVPDMPGPDDFQQQVIAAEDRSIRVIAPAGAGKTQTLVRRVMRRIEEGVAPRRILVLTFDRNAKRSFETMIQRMGMSMSPDVRTLNAFGWDVLRRNFPEERSEIVRSWQVLGNRGINPERSKHRIIKQFAEEADAKALLQIFDALKDHLFDPRDRAYKQRQNWIVENYRRLVPDAFSKRFPDRYAQEFADAISEEFRAYEHFLEQRNAIDYQDQKLRTLKLLQAHDDQRTMIQRRYDEIIVDEVQDINPLDAELIKTVAEQATLILTGDDDQAIYEFRWASPRFLIDPDAFFARTFQTFELSLNYRCPPKILDHALPLIANNVERVAKQPKAHKPEGGEVSLDSAPTALLEARSLLKWIAKVKDESPELKYQDFAVLYRVNAQHYLIQTELFRNRIPYTVNERFDLRIIWRKALTLLELSSKLRGGEPLPPEDRRTFLQLYPSFGGLRPPDIQRIVMAGSDTEKFPGTGTIAAIGEIQSSGSATYFRSAIRSLVSAPTLDDELEVIASRFLGFTEQSDQEVDASPMEELQEIARKMNVPRDQFIQRFGRFLYSAEAEMGNANDRGVELSTCHGAKGREWKVVILPSCNQGKFPDFRSSLDPQDLEAERRLFYVSMTRASQRLRISYLKADEATPDPKQRKAPEPSQFLYEAKLLDEPLVKPKNAPLVYEAPRERKSRATSSYADRSERPTRPRCATGTSSGSARSSRSAGGSARSSGGTTSRRSASSSTTSEGTITSVTPEVLPAMDITMPDKTKRRMDFRRDGDIRRFVAELTSAPEPSRIGKMTVEYDRPESTYPLQLAFLVKGIPYHIADRDRLLESSHFASVYKILTNDDETTFRSAEAMSRPPDAAEADLKGLAVRLLTRAAHEFDISARKNTKTLEDAIAHVIRTTADRDAKGVRFVRKGASS